MMHECCWGTVSPQSMESLETGMITPWCYILELHALVRPDTVVLITRS
jgi:hypothetical protein